MQDLRKTIEDHYLTFILVATASVALIVSVVWGITVFVKRIHK